MLTLGLAFAAVTLLFMLSGAPIAFALGAVAVAFMAIFMPAASLDTITQNVYEEMASITLLSIPLFILKGAAIGGTLAILLPPSITMILYAVAAEQSLGRLFLAGIGPGLLLVLLFAGYAVLRYRHEHRRAIAAHAHDGTASALLDVDVYTLRQKV